MSTTHSRVARTHSILAVVWLLLFWVQFTADSQGTVRAASPSLLVVAACADVLLLLIPIGAAFSMVRLARGHDWRTRELLIAWCWVTALILATVHAGSPGRFAAEVSTHSVYIAVLWVRRICQLVIAPLAVIAGAAISMKGLRGRSWSFRLAMTTIPIVLLLWIWLARPHSP